MIFVTGGTGYVGGFLLRRLAREKRRVCCLVRPGRDVGAIEGLGFEIVEGDVDNARELAPVLARAESIIHLVHIRSAPDLLSYADRKTKRIVLLSSLRRFSQVPSLSVQEIIDAECAVEQSDCPWVLLRPSMIYGPGDDRNISRLTAHLQRWRLQPVFGDGRNLHQPVYVEDVVEAIINALQIPGVERRTYALAGRRALSYRELIGAVGRAAGVSPIMLYLPVRPCIWFLDLLRRLGISPGIEPEQIWRLQEDKVYSIEAAQRDLNYDPLDLQQGLARTGNWTT